MKYSLSLDLCDLIQNKWISVCYYLPHCIMHSHCLFPESVHGHWPESVSHKQHKRCIYSWESIMSGFTFWISLSLSLLLRPNFRLRPNLIQKVKWRFWFGLSQSLSENFCWAFPWVRTLDSAIRSAKVNLNNSVLVQFTLHAVDSLIP